MSGTLAGGRKAAQKNLAKDPDFYRKLGRRGGSNGRGPNYQGGFAHPDADPSKAGRRGGRPRKDHKKVEV